MTKQEFLAMSLPYELKAQFKRDEKKGCRQKVIGTIGVVYDNGSVVCYDTVNAYPEKFKMILHPLSDLIKEIEHKGEKFVPINKLKTYFGWGYLWDCYKKGETINLYAIPYACLSKLVEWHFDIADLISKGEAIDVNTLEINPYK